MKRFVCLLVFLTVCMLSFAAAASAPKEEILPDRTDTTEEDFLGTWKLKVLIADGHSIPIAALEISATAVITPGLFVITGVTEETSQFETTFEDGHLLFMNGDQPMVISITENGLLHVDLETKEYEGTVEEEEQSSTKTFNLDLKKLGSLFIGQYFEKVESAEE